MAFGFSRAILVLLIAGGPAWLTHLPPKTQQSSTDLSRRRVVAGAVTLSVAGALSPAFAQPTDRTMQKPPGYSHVVEMTGPGRTVYFAGQLGIDKSGKMGANAREQVEIAFENVKAALASVGANFDHVVKLNNYIVDIGTNIAHYRDGGGQVAGATAEVEAIAVLPPK